MDWIVMMFALAVSLLTGIAFGLAPAVQLSRTDPHEGLKEGTRGASAGGARPVTRKLLIGSEVALSLVLLVGAALLIESFWKLQRVDPGFAPEQILSMEMSLPIAKYEEGEQIPFYERLYERLMLIAPTACTPATDACGV